MQPDDDVIYAAAMLMFAALPLLSMSSRSRRQLGDRIDVGRVTAVVAFVLLLWLQCRKRYMLGVAMVMVNLLYATAMLGLHATTDPASNMFRVHADSFNRRCASRAAFSAQAPGLRACLL